MAVIHFIAVGGAGMDFHLAGIPRFGADEVVLVSHPESSILPQIIESLKNFGVEYRQIIVKEAEYLDTLRKTNEEAAACMEDDTCIGINMSTNAGIITSAIEDAVRIQLYSFHKRRLSKVNCSAFRYYITLAEKPIFSIAPIWNQFNEVHNDIFDILSDTELYAGTKMPISLSKIWKSYTLIRPDAERRESFRKTFRRFKCWMKKNPCFIEQMQKNPCYKIQL